MYLTLCSKNRVEKIFFGVYAKIWLKIRIFSMTEKIEVIFVLKLYVTSYML